MKNIHFLLFNSKTKYNYSHFRRIKSNNIIFYTFFVDFVKVLFIVKYIVFFLKIRYNNKVENN